MERRDQIKSESQMAEFKKGGKLMKRFLAVLISSILIFGTCRVFAETEEDAPILFRDIEWGVSLPDALQGMPEGAKFFDLESDSSYTVAGMMLDEHDQYFDGNVSGYVSARSSSLEGVEIAGYELSGIRLRFALVPDENGMLVEDDSHTKLYYAMYEISPKDVDAAYADLVTKLSSLYGNPASTKDAGYSIEQKYTTWYGADNTMLVLLSEKFSSGSSEIEIRYGTTDGDAWLQEAYDALVKQESINAASNVEGL